MGEKDAYDAGDAGKGETAVLGGGKLHGLRREGRFSKRRRGKRFLPRHRKGGPQKGGRWGIRRRKRGKRLSRRPEGGKAAPLGHVSPQNRRTPLTGAMPRIAVVVRLPRRREERGPTTRGDGFSVGVWEGLELVYFGKRRPLAPRIAEREKKKSVAWSSSGKWGRGWNRRKEKSRSIGVEDFERGGKHSQAHPVEKHLLFPIRKGEEGRAWHRCRGKKRRVETNGGGKRVPSSQLQKKASRGEITLPWKGKGREEKVHRR